MLRTSLDRFQKLGIRIRAIGEKYENGPNGKKWEFRMLHLGTILGVNGAGVARYGLILGQNGAGRFWEALGWLLEPGNAIF